MPQAGRRKSGLGGAGRRGDDVGVVLAQDVAAAQDDQRVTRGQLPRAIAGGGPGSVAGAGVGVIAVRGDVDRERFDNLRQSSIIQPALNYYRRL